MFPKTSNARRPVLGVSLSGFDAEDKIINEDVRNRFEVFNPKLKQRNSDLIFEMFQHCDVVISGTEPLQTLVSKSKNLKLVCRAGLGIDNCAIDIANERGILVYNSTTPVVENVSTLAQVVITAISLGMIQNKINLAGQWRDYRPLGIGESSIGILGVGRIGSRILEKLANMGFKKIGLHDKHDLKPILEKYADSGPEVSEVSLESCFSNFDIVSVNLPLTVDTKDLVNYDLLKKMASHSWLVNLARGGIVVESDLVRILQEDRIGGAMLDVFNLEPYTGPLIHQSKTYLTSHIGTYNKATRFEMEKELVNYATEFFYGPQHLKGVR